MLSKKPDMPKRDRRDAKKTGVPKRVKKNVPGRRAAAAVSEVTRPNPSGAPRAGRVARALADRAVALLAAAIMALSLAGSAYALNDYKLANASELAQPTVTSNLGVNMQKRSYTPSVSYKLSLVYASVELDLSVTVVDEYGEIVVGYPFEVTVTPDGGGDPVTETDDDKDGQIYFEGLAEGAYSVALAPAEGYTVPDAPSVAEVQPKTTYEKVDVSSKIKQASEVNVAEDDKKYGSAGGADGSGGAVTTPVDSDTVEFVPSDKKETSATVRQPVLDSSGNQVVKYTASLSGDGYILLSSGAASEYKAIVTDGYLTGATKLVTVAAGAASRSQSLSVVPLNAGGETAPTPSPSPEPAPTPTPTPTPAPSPSPAPATKTITYALQGTQLVPDDGSAGVDISSGYSITAVPQTQDVTTATTTYYGWQTLDGKTYYFNKNGVKVTGRQVIQGVTYSFDADGVMQSQSSGKSIGIDVSTWQDSINWSKVKAAGVEFAFIRLGFRGYASGSLVEDSRFRQNIAGATAAGLKVGVYFFTQAVNEAEAVEEASMCLQLVAGYRLAYPIAIDIEYAAWNARTNGMNNAQRTKVCVAFCETIRNAGYTPAVYACNYYFTSMLNTVQLESYVIWLAHYTQQTNYARRYDIWQYSAKGSVNGVPGSVDMNISYLSY